MQYEDYAVQDFVLDSNFRRWVTDPDDIDDFFWEAFQKDYPGQTDSVHTAKQIVKALSFAEETIEREEYQSSLNILKNRISERKQKSNRIKLFTQWWAKVAAILILPFIAVSLYFFFTHSPIKDNEEKMVQYIVPNGQKSNIILADGTSVWLNSGSKLTYPLTDSPSERKVYLIGEAYFNVTKDKKRPFLVETGDYTVKVYGTSFNVRAYAGQNESETILEEGSISILTPDKQEIKMIPGQRFLLNHDKKYQLSIVNPDMYVCWKDNILKVNNEELQHLIIRLERWYGVKIKVADFEKVKNIRYTLTIKTESFREMLELMKYVTPFTYSIDGEEVTLDYKI